jgi:hypothetical protein
MALTATVEPEVKNVRLDYAAPATAVSVTFTRTGPSGVPAGVRGWQNTTVTGGSTVIARDFEAPIGVPLTYTAQAKNSSGAVIGTQTTTITIPSGGVCDMWLNDLARVGNTLKITIDSLPELDYVLFTSVHDVIDRRDPIVSSDIAHTPAFTLSFVTDTLDERDQAKSALGNGVPVLLRTPPDDGIGNLYFAVTDYKEQRVVQPADMPARLFVVDGRQVQRPDPTLYQPIAPATYQYVKDTFATYADLKAQRVNYDAVLYDWTGAQPSDVVPWLPDDV